MAKRPYSTKYRARQNPRRYLLSGIPPTLWEGARARARREGIAMRSLLLTLLDDWLQSSRDNNNLETVAQPGEEGIGR